MSHTKFGKNIQALYELAGEVGTLGENDPRYADVYAKLSDALDAAEEAGLIWNESDEEGSPRVIYTARRFGIDPRQGVHLYQPSRREIEDAVQSASKDLFTKVYIHANGRKERV